jgi:hypothetical protein
MASLNSNNIIPFIIICFCLLIFVGILRNKKSEKINNIMEKFINNENFINNNIENFSNEGEINPELITPESNKNFISEYTHGFWTTPGTTLTKESIATELMEINLIDGKGYIQLPKLEGNIYFNGLRYKIIFSKGSSIVSTSKDSPYTLSITIIYISREKNYGKDGLLLTTNVPLAKVAFIDNNNNILLNIYSYKIPENKKIEPGQLKDIILSKSYNGDEIKDIYNIPSYIKIIGGNYKFLENSISFNFGVKCNLKPEINNYCNIIKNRYANKLLFRISREFTAPNGSVIKTQASDIYILDAIKTIGNNIIEIPDKINILPAIKDIELNKINYNEYVPYSIIIYFYQSKNTSINYDFKNSTKINSLDFKFDNNSSSMLPKYIDTNALNTLTQNIDSNYTITKFKTILTTPDTDINKSISIPFSDLYQLLTN